MAAILPSFQFGPSATTPGDLERAFGQGRLAVYDMRDRRVRTLVDGPLPAGPHTALWNGADDTDRPLPSGAYFCRLFAEGVTVMQSAVLLR